MLGKNLNIDTDAFPNEMSPSMYSEAYLLTTFVSKGEENTVWSIISTASHIPAIHIVPFNKIFKIFPVLSLFILMPDINNLQIYCFFYDVCFFMSNTLITFLLHMWTVMLIFVRLNSIKL